MFCLSFAATPLRADELKDTSAFERAYATSLYTFDGCGDGLTGRAFRKALDEKFAHCPFTDEARARYRERMALQRRKSSAAIAKMVDANSGLPVRLDGMSMTCREQRASTPFQQLDAQLQQYQAGQISVDAVIPAKCDADNVLP